ncbi:hypothetical protein ACLB2K_030669 [Fragaria x ananassa]
MSSTESQDQRRLTFIFSWASQWDPLSGVELRNFNRTNALFKYMFFKSRTRASIHSPIDIAEPKLFGERWFMVPISDAIAERDVYKEIIAGYLSTMIVLLGNTETTIMQTIYKAIEKAEAGWPIDVVVMSVTVNILGKSVVVPTTESVFHRLDNVRLDNLESSTRQKPCRLCSKSLDHFHDGGEGITRLPCSHIFHVGCFVQCLELSPMQICPTCHHQLHIAGAPRASEPWDWPLFLMVTAGPILTGLLIGKLFILLKRP